MPSICSVAGLHETMRPVASVDRIIRLALSRMARCSISDSRSDSSRCLAGRDVFVIPDRAVVGPGWVDGLARDAHPEGFAVAAQVDGFADVGLAAAEGGVGRLADGGVGLVVEVHDPGRLASQLTGPQP